MYICSVGMDILQYARRTSCFSLGLGLAVIIVQFCIVYHSVARERDRGSRCFFRVSSVYFAILECISYGTQEGIRVSR